MAVKISISDSFLLNVELQSVGHQAIPMVLIHTADVESIVRTHAH